MNRRDTIKAMAALAAYPTWASAFQGPTDEMSLPELMKAVMPMMGSAPIQSEPLSPTLSMITGPGGNIAALTGTDGLILVDSFVPSGSAGLIAAARSLSSGPITLINTHWHFDHTGGNVALAGLGAKIIAHENARKRLGSPQVMTDFQLQIPASPPAALPVVTIGDEAHFYLNNEEIEAAHVSPAHTDGDIFVYFRKANVLHTGDLFSNGFYPNIDSASDGWVGGMVAAADRILKLVNPSTRIIPGHGPLATPADLKAFRDMLAEAQAKIEPMVAAGKTLPEAIAAKPLASLDPRWSKGLFKNSHFTQLVYSGLAKHRGKV